MEENSTKTQADGTALFAGDLWFDPIEAGIRERVRGFIEELIEQELGTWCWAAAATSGMRESAERLPERDARAPDAPAAFGPVQISVPRARLAAEGGGTQEWRSSPRCPATPG